MYKKLTSYFSTISKKRITDSSYDTLAETIRKQYNFKEFKVPSALSLLQTHHQFHIFKPGDWVLDIGAGPFFSWTDLALKLTQNEEMSNLVISNDMSETIRKTENNIFIRGKFQEEPIKTKIAMHLLQRQLNTILVDATDEYQGQIHLDSSYTMDIALQSLKFSDKYLKKGGTMVLRTLKSNKSDYFFENSNLYFNESYEYKPTNLRYGSPVNFYIFKGFMMTPNFRGASNFMKEYKGSASKKIALVEKYKKKYTFDPILIIQSQAKERIAQMKKNGFKNKEIAKVYEDQPFVKINQILGYFNTIDDPKSEEYQKVMAKQKLLRNKNFFESQETLPTTQQQFAQFFLKPKKQQKKVSNAPLGENQSYLKEAVTQNEKQDDEWQQNVYLKEDLYGYPVEDEIDHEGEPAQEQFQKIKKSFIELNPQKEKEANDMTFEKMMKEMQNRDFDEQNLKQKEQGQLQEQLSMKRKIQKQNYDRQVEEEEENYNERTQFRRSKQPKAERYVNKRISKRKRQNMN